MHGSSLVRVWLPVRNGLSMVLCGMSRDDHSNASTRASFEKGLKKVRVGYVGGFVARKLKSEVPKLFIQ
jgi:hypothetical protein